MIKLKEKIGYGLGDMASSMFWKLFGSYLMIFYTDVFGMSAAVVGTMFLVTRVWDSAFDPIVGIIADRTHSRWGKFRPYLLFLAFPFAFIGILTFTTPEWSMTAKIVYAYITYSLMMMVYSAIQCALCFSVRCNECRTARSQCTVCLPHGICLFGQFHRIAAVHAYGECF